MIHHLLDMVVLNTLHHDLTICIIVYLMELAQEYVKTYSNYKQNQTI
jgi:hypothetical protein